MKIRINHSIDVVGLVDALNASPTRATNLKYKIYYFLSLLTDTNDNYRLNDSNDGTIQMVKIQRATAKDIELHPNTIQVKWYSKPYQIGFQK